MLRVLIMPDKYLVLGNPIAHSLSPQIHRYFALQTGEDIQYQAHLVETNLFSQTVNDLINTGILGFNITVPFKEQAFDFVDEKSDAAIKARAVNTIKVLENGKTLGENTDGRGFLNDLVTHKKFKLQDKRILILGAGGATRGILGPLLSANLQEVVIANRTLEKAKNLINEFSEFSNLTAHHLSAIPAMKFDLIINATSAGLQQLTISIPTKCIEETTICYDLSYGNTAKYFIDQMNLMGARDCYDGWGMLVEQAALAFNIWRNIKPNTMSLVQNRNIL